MTIYFPVKYWDVHAHILHSAVTTDCYTYAKLSRLRCAHAARSALYRLAPAQTGEPWSPKPPRFGFQPSILKSASSASLLIAVQGIEWLLARNLRLPSHGLARPQHTGRGSRPHSFNFHNITIPRFDPGSAALRGGADIVTYVFRRAASRSAF